jgi:hypothetical protein
MQVTSTFVNECRGHRPPMYFKGRGLYHTHGRNCVDRLDVLKPGAPPHVCTRIFFAVNRIKAIAIVVFSSDIYSFALVYYEARGIELDLVQNGSRSDNISVVDAGVSYDEIAAISGSRLVGVTESRTKIWNLIIEEGRIKSDILFDIVLSGAYVEMPLHGLFIVAALLDPIWAFSLAEPNKNRHERGSFSTGGFTHSRLKLCAADPETLVSVSRVFGIKIWKVTKTEFIPIRGIDAAFQDEPVVTALRDERHFITGPHAGRCMKVWATDSTGMVAKIDLDTGEMVDGRPVYFVPYSVASCQWYDVLVFYSQYYGLVVKRLSRVEFPLFNVRLVSGTAVKVYSDGRKKTFGGEEDPEKAWEWAVEHTVQGKNAAVTLRRNLLRIESRRGRNVHDYEMISKCDEFQIWAIQQMKKFKRCIPKDVTELIVNMVFSGK